VKSKKSLFTNRSCNQQESLQFSPSLRNYHHIKKRLSGESSYFFINRKISSMICRREGATTSWPLSIMSAVFQTENSCGELTSIRCLKGGFPLGGRTQSTFIF
jgi:hypothetical protein